MGLLTFSGDDVAAFYQRQAANPSLPHGHPLAVFGESPIPPPLQNLHHRLLDKTIQHRKSPNRTAGCESCERSRANLSMPSTQI
jgi:hypothetical protein